jgi:hypothetical protein
MALNTLIKEMMLWQCQKAEKLTQISIGKRKTLQERAVSE